jgi:DNA-binding PadR family transcriptional regulator
MKPPLTPATFHILLALAGGERHGYAIMREVAEQTEEAIRLGPGTLYGTLKRLVDEGLIEELDEREEGDARRRYYRLTRAGRALAAAESKRLLAAVRDARRKRLIGPERI